MENKSKGSLKSNETAERIRRLAMIDFGTKELDIKISYKNVSQK